MSGDLGPADLPTFSGRRASQHPLELGRFIALLNTEGVGSYCEIGARHGDTFHEVMRRLGPGARGVACDLPGGLWGDRRTGEWLKRAVADLRDYGLQAECFFGNSQSAAMLKLVYSRGPFDAILIDGDHTLEGVIADWTAYQDVARLVAFHDIVGHGQAEKRYGRPVEVPVLWESIKASGRRTVELVAPGSKMGIGVVWMR